MSTRFFGSNESLEATRVKLMEAVKAPVFVVAPYGSWQIDCKYKRPGELTYRTMGKLEYYLSGLNDNNHCVGREPMSEEDRKRIKPEPREWRLFDLSPATSLCFAYPLMSEQYCTKREDGTHDFGVNDFKSIGFHSALNANRHIEHFSPDENVPRELKPYIFDYKKRTFGTFKLAPGILFARSEMFEAPNELRMDWHVGVKTESFTTLQAPGWYSGSPVMTAEDHNRFVMADRDPGPCVNCHGASGERVHLGVLQAGSPSYALNFVCRVCTPMAFKQWQTMLDEMKKA